jgi:peroxiredoxin
MPFPLAPGGRAPDFDLPGSDGRRHSFFGASSVQGKRGTLLFFTCNHCPYVVGSEDRMKALYDRIAPDIAMVAVHSNETKDHPADAFPLVIARMRDKGFRWLSLHDEAQFTARAYGAMRTPHYFLFDRDGRLHYSGRMDNSPRDAAKVETRELQDAIDDMLAGKSARLARTDAIGCNVKWWDREAHWMPGDACDLDYLNTRLTSLPPHHR